MNIQRALLFLIGCIGVRSLFVYLAYAVSPTILSYLGALALLLAIGFITIYVFGLRKTGLEVGGEAIWWNDLRPVHALLYGAFAAAAIAKKQWAWMILLADVVLGLGAWTHHHFFRT
jgi:hypothetical protein